MPRWFEIIKTEALKSPAKSLALGGLLLVAIYFWWPLVAGWVAPAEDGPTPDLVDEDAQRVAASQAAGKAKPGDWEELQAELLQSPWRRPRLALTVDRNPFETPAKVVREPKTKPRATAEVQPAPAGWELTSTLIGAGRTLAVINGRTYPLSAELPTRAEPREALRLVAIEPGYVVLAGAGQRLRLDLTKKP